MLLNFLLNSFFSRALFLVDNVSYTVLINGLSKYSMSLYRYICIDLDDVGSHPYRYMADLQVDVRAIKIKPNLLVASAIVSLIIYKTGFFYLYNQDKH